MTITVGFIGLGTMGRPMVKNLARAGYSMRLCSRHPENAEALAADLGGQARACKTPAELAAGAQLIISCVPDTPDVEAVHLGPGGTVEGAAPGTIVIDCSTIAPSGAERVARGLAERGVDALDAPMSGGQKGAIEGTLSFFVGGEAPVVERARPVLSAIGKRITRLGPAGAGQLGKAVNQVIVSLNLLAISEGLAFAEQAGLPLQPLHEALTGGAANSWALEVLGKKMIDRDFKPAFAIKHQQKDLAIVLASARERGVPLPGVGLVHQLLSALEAKDRGDDGTQALLTLYESLSRAAH